MSRATPNNKKPDDRISVRLGNPLRTKLRKVVKRTGHEESDLARAALVLLFSSKSDDEITAAVIAARAQLVAS